MREVIKILKFITKPINTDKINDIDEEKLYAINERVAALVVLLDCCFVEYMKCINGPPVNIFPVSMPRLKFILSLIENNNSTRSMELISINSLFIQLHENEFVRDIRDDPPFYMRDTRSSEELDGSVNEILPIVKILVNKLLKLSAKNEINNDNNVKVHEQLREEVPPVVQTT